MINSVKCFRDIKSYEDRNGAIGFDNQNLAKISVGDDGCQTPIEGVPEKSGSGDSV